MTTTTLDHQVERRLQASEARYTRGRKTVVTALASAGGPMSAAELNTEIGGSVPLSSLYRSLSVLEGAGILDHHFGPGGITRYELAEWLQGHHHHLICVSCGRVEDLEISHALETELQGLVDQVGSSASFSPSDHALEIEGRCAECT